MCRIRVERFSSPDTSDATACDPLNSAFPNELHRVPGYFRMILLLIYTKVYLHSIFILILVYVGFILSLYVPMFLHLFIYLSIYLSINPTLIIFVAFTSVSPLGKLTMWPFFFNDLSHVCWFTGKTYWKVRDMFHSSL